MGPDRSVWLPRGLEFLSGLPTDLRKRRVIVPIQIFIDDSGAQGQRGSVIFAGLFAEAEAWARFADEWKRILRDEPRIRQFKMRDAAKLQGEFYQFSSAQRDAKLRALAH